MRQCTFALKQIIQGIVFNGNGVSTAHNVDSAVIANQPVVKCVVFCINQLININVIIGQIYVVPDTPESIPGII